MTGLVLCLFEGKEGLPMSPHVCYIPSVSQSMSQIWGLFEFPSLLNFPQWQNHFSVWWIHVDNTQSTGPEKRKRTWHLSPSSFPCLPPGHVFLFALACCFWIWGFSKHTPLLGFWAVWETKESFSSKLDQVIQLLRNTWKHMLVSWSCLKVLSRSVLKVVGGPIWPSSFS